MNVICVLLSLALGLELAVGQFIPSLNVAPPWSNETIPLGTECSCFFQQYQEPNSTRATGSVSVAFRYIGFNFAFQESNPSYECSCRGFFPSSSFVGGQRQALYQFEAPNYLPFLNACVEYDYRIPAALRASSTGWGVTSSSYFGYNYSAAPAPPCVDFLGNTCGGLPGVRTDLNLDYTYNPLNATATRGQVVRRCSAVVVRVACVTPLCGTGVRDCQLSTTYGPWSKCAIQPSGSCVKTRELLVLEEAANGGLSCDQLPGRIQTTSCSLTECQREACSFQLFQQRGNCTAPCGPATVTESVYNLTVTPSIICQSVQTGSPVTSTNQTCTENLPCVATGSSTPISIRCSIEGNAGFRGSGAARIVIDYGSRPTNNYTNSSLIAAFLVSVSSSGRSVAIKPNGISFSGNTTVIELAVNNTDAGLNTGANYSVVFDPTRAPNSSSILISSFRLRSFACATTIDRVPPVISLVSAAYSYPLGGLVVTFSEPVTNCSSGGYSLHSRFMAFTGITLSSNASFVDLSSDRTRLVYHLPVTVNSSVPSSAAIIDFPAGLFCDLSGNPNAAFSGTLGIDDYSTMTSLLPPGTANTLKVYSLNNSAVPFNGMSSGQVPATALIVSRFGINLTLSYNSSISLSLRLEYSLNRSSTINTIYFPIYKVTSELGGAFSNQFLAFFNPAGLFLAENLTNATLALLRVVSLSIEFPVMTSSRFQVPSTFPSLTLDGRTDRVTVIPAPYIVSAISSTGSSILDVTMSGVQPFNDLFSVRDFDYYGRNWILGMDLSFTEKLEFQMARAFEWGWFGTEALYYTWTGEGFTPLQSMVLVQNALTTPFQVIGTQMLAIGNSRSITRIQVFFSGEIGGFDVSNPLETIALNWTIPGVKNITIVDYEQDVMIMTYFLKVTCLTQCAFTGGVPVRITVQSIHGLYGVPLVPYNEELIVDAAKPAVESVVLVEKNAAVVVFTETLLNVSESSIKAALSPRADRVLYVPNNTFICYYDDLDCSTADFTVQKDTLIDLSGNLQQLGLSSKATCVASKTCSIADIPWLLAAIIVVYVGAGLCLGGHAVYRWRTGKWIP